MAAEWIEQRRGLWDRRLDRLGAVLAEPDNDPKEQP
jgi:hypothetical protein